MSARIRKLFENLWGTLINDPDEKEKNYSVFKPKIL